MATLHAHPPPFATYLRHHGLCTAHPDGVTLIRTLHRGWRVWDRKPKTMSLAKWRKLTEEDLAVMREHEPWRFAPITRLPSLRQVEAMMDGTSPITTPTGHVVEAVQLRGPDGSPSWPVVLGL